MIIIRKGGIWSIWREQLNGVREIFYFEGILDSRMYHTHQRVDCTYIAQRQKRRYELNANSQLNALQCMLFVSFFTSRFGSSIIPSCLLNRPRLQSSTSCDQIQETLLTHLVDSLLSSTLSHQSLGSGFARCLLSLDLSSSHSIE